MIQGRLPLTYDECRVRFRRAALVSGLEVQHHPIAARGPDGQALAVDSVWVGPRRPERALVVLSGVHGVEGFIGSALQCGFLGRLGDRDLGDNQLGDHELDGHRLDERTAVLLVHAVNPWGMAWWRRQNESNVDLNRNWRRDEIEPACTSGGAAPRPRLGSSKVWQSNSSVWTTLWCCTCTPVTDPVANSRCCPTSRSVALASRRAGRRVAFSGEQARRTLADGLRVQQVGAVTWPYLQAYLDDIVTVTEQEMLDAMRRIAFDAWLVAEPGFGLTRPVSDCLSRVLGGTRTAGERFCHPKPCSPRENVARVQNRDSMSGQ